MARIAVLGAGMVGTAIAIDLAKMHNVTSVDISMSSLEKLQHCEPKISVLQKDLSGHNNYDFLHPFDLVICAVPGFMGFKTLDAVIRQKKNVVDISFFPENALELDGLAKANNVTVIVDCGVAPGMSNLILGYYDSRMKLEKFECLVGGLPKIKVKPFEYKAPFSPIDVIEEYTRQARLVENGEIITKDALTDAELIDFKLYGKNVTLESFNTDGLRTLLFTMAHIPDMKEKTLRYPGHIHLVKALIDSGFFKTEKITIRNTELSPLEFSSAILINQWKLGEEEPEFTVMRITIEGKENGVKKKIVYELFDEYDPISKTSSMARTTGYTCTAAANLIINGLFNKKGVFPPEIVGRDEKCFLFIMNYLQQRGIQYRKN